MSRMNRWMIDYAKYSFWIIVWTWTPIFLAAVSVTLYWANDTTPPFRLISSTVFNAAPGKTLLIEMKVSRDISRGCSVRFSRVLLDHRGVRHMLGNMQEVSEEALANIERDTPGRFSVAAVVPSAAALGPAVLQTSLQYACNPFQKLVSPINVDLQIPIEVLPP